MDDLIEVDEVSGDEAELKIQTDSEDESVLKRSASPAAGVPQAKKARLQDQADGQSSASIIKSSKANSVEILDSGESPQFKNSCDAKLNVDANNSTGSRTSESVEPNEAVTPNWWIEPTFEETDDTNYDSDGSITVDEPENFQESPLVQEIVTKYVLPAENCKLKFQYPNKKEALLIKKCEQMHNILLRSASIHFDHKNGHTFDPVSQTFNFTVSLVFRHNRGGQLIDGSYISSRVFEKDNIESIIRNFLISPPASMAKSPGMEKMRQRLMSTWMASVASFYIGLPFWHRKRYQEVDPSHALLDCMRGKTVIDRPLLVVILKEDVPMENMKIASADDWANTRKYVEDCSRRYFEGTPKHIVEKLRKAELSRNETEILQSKELLTVRRMNALRKYVCEWQEIERNTSMANIPTQQLLDFIFVYRRYMVDGKKEATKLGFPSRLHSKSITQLKHRGYKLTRLDLQPPPQRLHLHYDKKQAPIASILIKQEFTPEELSEVKMVFLTKKEFLKTRKIDNRIKKQMQHAMKLFPEKHIVATVEGSVKQPAHVMQIISVKEPLVANEEIRPYGDAPKVLRKGAPYNVIQVERCSFEDYKEMQDMILLVNFRHAHDNVSTSRFIEMGSAIELFLQTIEKFMTVKWSTDERTVQEHQATSICVHLRRTSTIVTGGRGISSSASRAKAHANGNVMLALCLMMVVPFEMIVETMSKPSFDPKWITVVAYACRERMRHLVALSESAEFKDLLKFTGDFTHPLPPHLQDLYVQFMLRMRASGLQFWSEHKTIRIPVDLGVPNLESYGGQYFNFKSHKKQIHWIPISKGVVSVVRCVSDCQIDEKCRFGEASFEHGLIKEDTQFKICCPYSGSEHWMMSEVVMPEDSIVCLTARDFENRPFLDSWVDDINGLLIMEIAKHWNKRLVRTHTIQKRMQANRTTWMHVCTVMFEGIPSFFFAGTGEHIQIRQSRLVADSFIISSLCLMGIIPMELYTLIRTCGKQWITPVLHGCRARFAEFEIMMRNSFYFPLFNLSTANLWQDPNKESFPMLLPVAYEFYQRLRASGSTFWHANPVIPVPSDVELPQTRLPGGYFTFIQSTDLSDWTTMIPPLSESDTGGRLPTDKELSEFYTTFQRDLEWKKLRTKSGATNNELKNSIENCRVSKQTIGSLSILRDILEKIAELFGSQLEEKTTYNSETELYDVTVCFSGLFSTVFRSTDSSVTKEDAVNRSVCTLARRLMRCYLLPHELFPFITDCVDRLPYMIPTLYPMTVKASAIIKEYVKSSIIKEEERETVVQLALSCIRKECRKDAQWLIYSIPTELIPARKDQPFASIAIRELSSKDLWELKVKLAMNIGDSNGANVFARMPIHPAMPELNDEDMYIEEKLDEADMLEAETPVPDFRLPWEKLMHGQ